MNANNLQRFHNYLCAVVKYYQTHKSLKNFSNLAKDFKCKAITRELFFQFELDKVIGEPEREVSDNIRLLMAEMDIKRRQEQLKAYIDGQSIEQQNEEAEIEEALEKMPSLLERFEAHFRMFNDFIARVNTAAKEAGCDLGIKGWALENEGYDLLGFDCAYELLECREWSDRVEYRVAKTLFEPIDKKVLCDSLRQMGPNTMHAFLTYIFGDEDSTQLKFDFDARGDKSESNDAIEEALAEYGVFNDVAFHKLESWKGCGHMCIVYKDAPDVLMIVGEGGVDFYTVEDDIFYSYCGDTIIDPGVGCHFGGWGTRSIMAECIKDIFLCKDEAMRQQASVPERFKGKLLDDLHHIDDIRAMYKEEYARKVITSK